MPAKKHIGQLLSFQYKDRVDAIRGLVIMYNDEFTLLKQNSVDYVIDGYIVLKNKFILGYKRDAYEKFTEKVIKLKGKGVTDDEQIPLDNLEVILSYISKKYGVFEIETKSEKYLHLGCLIVYNSKHFVIRNLNPKGKWSRRKTFRVLTSVLSNLIPTMQMLYG